MNRLRPSGPSPDMSTVRRFDGGVVYLRVPAFVEQLSDGGARYLAAMLRPYVGASCSTLHDRARYGGRKGRRALRRLRLGLYTPDKPKFVAVSRDVVLAETLTGTFSGEWVATRATRFTDVASSVHGPGLIVESIRMANLELLMAPVDARTPGHVEFPVLGRGERLHVVARAVRDVGPTVVFRFSGLEAV
jgi:hypothetical protein